MTFRQACRAIRRSAVAAVALVLLLSTIVPADAGAGRSRPGGNSSSGRAGGAARSTGTAGGKATYGHGGSHPGGHGHHAYYGYYGHYGYPYHYYGYPYFFWPYWGWWGSPRVYVIGQPGNPEEMPGVVETDVKPKKAEVRVDGRYVGQARDYNGRWDQLWLPPGRHQLEFSREGYMTLRVGILLRGGEALRVAEQLHEGEGIDPRSTEPPAPDPASRPAVTRQPAERPMPEPSPGSLRRGLLRLVVLPDDAAVYLDGKFLARAGELNRLHGALPVAQGVHAVEVVRPGFRSETVEIDVGGEEPVELSVELERED